MSNLKLRFWCHYKGWVLPFGINYLDKNLVISILCFGCQISWAVYPMEIY